MSEGDSGSATRTVVTAFPARGGRGAVSSGSLAFDDLMRRFFVAKAAEAVLLDHAVGRSERGEELMQRIMMTPAPEARHLRFKMRIFCEEMQAASDDGWVRHARIMAMFAALQSDVLRFVDDAPAED